MSQKSSLKKQAFTTCTLKDLCPADKEKVAQLVRQVVELGKENQQLKATAATASTAEEKLRQIQDCNKQAVKENCNLKNKLGQAVTVLRMYHHKVQGLDAALRVLQHQAPADQAASPQQQQEEQQQQQDDREEQQVCNTPALPAPPAVPANPLKAAEQEQIDQPDANTSATTAQQQQGGPTDVRQQQGLLQHTPGVAGSTAGQTPANSPSYHNNGCCMHANGPAQQQLLQQQQQQQLLLNSQFCGVLQGSHTLPGGSPALGMPLHQMQAWQLQDRHLAEQQPRTVLQFDPSIGSCGAYVVQQLPEPPLLLMDSNTPHPAAHSSIGTSPSAADGTHAAPHTFGHQQESPYQAGASGAGQQRQQEQQQREGRVVSAGGAATAAAAAAASSALAAVKAAAAMCAAPTLQPNLSNCSISSSPRQEHSQYPAAACLTGCMVGSRCSEVQGPGVLDAGSWGVAAGPVGTHQESEAGTSVEEVPLFDMAPGAVHVLVQNEKSASSLHQAHARVTLAGGMGGSAVSPASASVLLPAFPRPSEAADADGAAAGAESSDVQVLWQPRDPQDAWPSNSSRMAQQQQQQAADLQRCWVGTDDRDQQGQVQQWVRQHQQQQQEMDAHAAQHSFMGSSVGPAGAAQHLAQQQQQQQQLQHKQPGWTQQLPAANGLSSNPGQAAAAGIPRPRPAPTQQQQLQGYHADSNWQQQQQQQAPPHMQRRSQPSAPQQQRQQQLQGYVSDGMPTVDRVSGTRELLLKFDESLLDILAEVERLEHQQQQARQQLHGQQEGQHTQLMHPQLPPQQQKQQQQQQLPPQPHQLPLQQQQSYERQPAGAAADEGWPAKRGAPLAGGLSVSAAGRSQQTYLSHKQAQLQQRIQQLQQEGPPLRHGLTAAAGARSHVDGLQLQQMPPAAAAAAWGYQGVSADYDADDVSDILNHLD